MRRTIIFFIHIPTDKIYWPKCRSGGSYLLQKSFRFIVALFSQTSLGTYGFDFYLWGDKSFFVFGAFLICLVLIIFIFKLSWKYRLKIFLHFYPLSLLNALVTIFQRQNGHYIYYLTHFPAPALGLTIYPIKSCMCHVIPCSFQIFFHPNPTC